MNPMQVLDEAFTKALDRSREIISDTFRYTQEVLAGLKGETVTATGYRNNRARKAHGDLTKFAALRDVSLSVLVAQIQSLNVDWEKVTNFVNSVRNSLPSAISAQHTAFSDETQAFLADKAIEASAPIAISSEFQQALKNEAQIIAVENAPLVEQLADPDFIGPFPRQQHFLSRAYHDSAISYEALEAGVLRNAGILRHGHELAAVAPEIFERVRDRFNSIAPDHIQDARVIHTFRQVAFDEETTLRLASYTDTPKGLNGGPQVVLRFNKVDAFDSLNQAGSRASAPAYVIA